VQLADLLEANDLGPEPVGLLDVADIQNNMIHPDRRSAIVGLVSVIARDVSPLAYSITSP
jgi:hypothetical protein